MTLFKEKRLYYVRAGFVKGSLRLMPGFEHCNHLLLYDTHKRKELFKLSENGPRVVSAEQLRSQGFDPKYDFYLAFDIKEEILLDDNTKEKIQIKKNNNPFSKEPYFATLKDILGDKDFG